MKYNRQGKIYKSEADQKKTTDGENKEKGMWKEEMQSTVSYQEIRYYLILQICLNIEFKLLARCIKVIHNFSI